MIGPAQRPTISTLGVEIRGVTALAFDPNVLRGSAGYLVADVRGRMVGQVESASEGADRLTVRSGWPRRRRRIVPASAIEEIDMTSRIIALHVERESLRFV
jgi:hypothetical protein